MPEFKQPANNASDGEVLSWFRGQAAEHGGSDATDTEVLGWFREQAAANDHANNVNAYHEERELTPLELARARNEALREEMEREPFIHIPAEEDYRAHQRTDEKQWSKAAMIREAEAERYARHSELVHVTSEQDDHLNTLLDQSRVSQQFVHEELAGCQQYPAHPSERIYGYGEMRLKAHESEKKVSDALQETRHRMISKLESVASRKSTELPKITQSAAEYRKSMMEQAGYLPEPATSTAGDQLKTTTTTSSSKVSVAPPTTSHGIHQTSAKEYVDFMRATLEFDTKAQHTADNQNGLGAQDRPAINYGGLRTASEREKNEHEERDSYKEARDRREKLAQELKNEERYDERHGGY